MYEYDYEAIFNEEQLAAIEMGLTDKINVEEIIKLKMNERGDDGWEPLMPLQLPSMWFKRKKIKRMIDDINNSDSIINNGT